MVRKSCSNDRILSIDHNIVVQTIQDQNNIIKIKMINEMHENEIMKERQ